MTQRIAGEPTEAMKAFAERGIVPTTDPSYDHKLRIKSPIWVRKAPVKGSVVNEPGISEHPTWAVAEPTTRKQRVRAEVAKRRAERERTKPIERIGPPTRAKYGDTRCSLCRKPIIKGGLICKASTGWAHENCFDPKSEKQMTQQRQAIRDSVASSRYSAV